MFPKARFFGADGRFHETTDKYSLFSAANWSASARYLGQVHGDILFIDIGSTTTDIIPVKNGLPVAGLTDFERLTRSELIYAGTLRTNLAAIIPTVEVRGLKARTSSELFAITGDVYMLLGMISPGDYTCDTPDGDKKDIEGAARRIARLVCCDLEELSPEDVREIAEQAHRSQVEDLKKAIIHVSTAYGLKKAAICGLGAFIARDALAGLGMPYTQVQDNRLSKVFPAYAVARLLDYLEED